MTTDYIDRDPVTGRTRQVAAPPNRAGGKARWRGGSGIPRGVHLDVTTPHDCRNHIPEFEDEDARLARLQAEAGAQPSFAVRHEREDDGLYASEVIIDSEVALL